MAFRQLATTPTVADNNFTHQAANLGIVLDQFVFNKVFSTTVSGTWRLGVQLPV